MQAERFMYFCSKNYIGTQSEDLSTVKVLLPPTPVVDATDRSKAVVLVLFLLCVALWFLLQGISC